MIRLDALAQAPLSDDFDTTLVVLAPPPAAVRPLRGHAHATPETLHRRFIDTKRELHLTSGRVEARLRRRADTPILFEVGCAQRTVEVPRWGGRTLNCVISAPSPRET